jgi:GNAT superfamily N-acetyltransferase
MWIDEAYRGRGYARQLLDAFVAEAARRGVRRIWVASYDFQAPDRSSSTTAIRKLPLVYSSVACRRRAMPFM